MRPSFIFEPIFDDPITLQNNTESAVLHFQVRFVLNSVSDTRLEKALLGFTLNYKKEVK